MSIKLVIFSLLTFGVSACAYSQQAEAPNPQVNSSENKTKVASPQEIQVIEQTAPIMVMETMQVEPSTDTSLISPKQPEEPVTIIENPWSFLHPYQAVYDVYSEGDHLGSASRRLIFDKQSWRLSIASSLKKWMISLKSEEKTHFQITHNQLRTMEFSTYSKVSFKSSREIKQIFDWQKMLETGQRDDEKWKLTFSTDQPIFDRMSHVIQLRADLIAGKNIFEYTISYKGRRKVYQYEKQQSEIIITAMGKFNAVKLVRVGGDDTHFSMWLSPELNYFPIKISQVEQDKPDVELVLKTLEFLSVNKKTSGKTDPKTPSPIN